jgi:hypothetical protein
MEELETINRQLQGELENTQRVLTEQREVIVALGHLVSEMMRTFTYYEFLLQQAAETIQASQAKIKELNQTQSGAP